MFVELVCISTNIEFTCPKFASSERSCFCLSIDTIFTSLAFSSVKIYSQSYRRHAWKSNHFHTIVLNDLSETTPTIAIFLPYSSLRNTVIYLLLVSH